ncbi:myosin regulatory light chain 2, smooth muscle minor isoform [Maniola jurtina]|uniref:myosin regulatory light chain 2, smooth muscle minor isoform n=1 Tax=Maniola jurtina TaxID=191418 RepID=UPI001E68B20E|nr:myosin regulatory light chain 2, smooth muscle minor isoform [Maniola jurtina]
MIISTAGIAMKISAVRICLDTLVGKPTESCSHVPGYISKMEDEPVKTKSKKSKSEKSKRKESDPAQDEIKKFKENLLQSAPAGESILSDSSDIMLEEPRSYSLSKARESLSVPANVLAELDENKIFELKEAFLLFDLDGDGCIDHNDLRGTLVSLGENIDEQMINTMLSEAANPLDFDSFVNLLGYKTLELDSEETLIAALSRWDTDNTGYISEDRIRHDLMTWGDRFTEKEADYALDEAPVINKNGYNFIDYKQFCATLSGLRKPNKKALEV